MVDELRHGSDPEQCGSQFFPPLQSSQEEVPAVKATSARLSVATADRFGRPRSVRDVGALQTAFARLAIFSCGLVLLAGSFATCAEAQSGPLRGARASLFSRSALAKAYATGTTRSVPSSQSNQQTAAAAQVDSVAEILSSDSGSARILGDYRGLFYLAYVRDLVGLPELDTTDTNKLAERAAAYQGAEIFAKEIVGTALEPIYKDFLKNLRWIRQYTSVRVVESGRGDMNLSSKVTKEPPLMEFKLHVSANNLIEPRMKFGKDVTLRYDVIHEVGVLEYRYDF